MDRPHFIPRFSAVTENSLSDFAADLRAKVFTSQTLAANFLNLHPSTVQRYEDGSIKKPPLGYLVCLIAVFGERWGDREEILHELNKAIDEDYLGTPPFDNWEELYRVASDYRQKRFPGNLPPKPKPEEFFGYTAEIDRAIEGLETHHPLISIEGVQGVGKTMLALEVAHRYCLDFKKLLNRVGVWVSAESQPEKKLWLEDVFDIVIRQLGRHSSLKTTLEDKRREVDKILASSPTLVIIDHYETIGDPDLDDWILHVPRLSRVMITSRVCQERLQQKAWTVCLEGLSQKDALTFIRFHIRRLGLRRLRSALDDELDLLITETKGNPKIIQLALGYVDAVGGDISAAVDYAAQKQNLWEREWKILSEGAQRGLMIASFFHNVSKDALGQVGQLDTIELREALGQLTRMYLLDTDVEDRRRYKLHSLVRSFAKRKLGELAQEDRDQFRNAWIRYLLDYAERHLVQHGDLGEHRYWNSQIMSGLQPVDEEWRNLKLLLEWSVQEGNGEIAIELMFLLVHYMDRRARFAERLDFSRKAAASAGKLKRPVDQALFHIDAIGWILIAEGRVKEAIKEIEDGLRIARSLGPEGDNAKRNLAALAQAFLAAAYLVHDRAQAWDLINKVLELKDDYSPVIRSRVAMVAGDVQFSNGNYREAIELYEEAEQYSYPAKIATMRLGQASLKQGQLERASLAFDSVLSTQKQDRTIDVIRANLGMAHVAEMQGDITGALEYAHQTSNLIGPMKSQYQLAKLSIETEELLKELGGLV